MPCKYSGKCCNSTDYLSWKVLVFVYMFTLAGCVTTPPTPVDPKMYPSAAVYSYQPLDPITVWTRDPTEKEIAEGYLDADERSFDFNKALLMDLDTETVRIALNTLGGNVGLNAGITGITVEGQSYALTVDYIKYIKITKLIEKDYVSVNVKGEKTDKNFNESIPVYAGIGLRIRADFKAHKSGLKISGLKAVAVAAGSNGISGRLTVQTLGITGPEITKLMPIISDISEESVNKAIQAVDDMKGHIYDETTTVSPKIVGFDTPDRDPELIKVITKHLSESEEKIMPVLTKHPQDDGKYIYWIDWFSPFPKE